MGSEMCIRDRRCIVGTESGIRNMTVGSPFRHILMFTLPLLAGNFLQQFYNMVDSWVVGNYVSDGALAAVGVGFPVIFLFTSLFSGIATGGTVVIAQSFGGGRPDRVRSAIDSLYTAFIRSILPITAAALLLVRKANQTGAPLCAELIYGDANTKLTFPLETDADYDVDTGYLTVHIRIQNGAARFVDSPCPDHVCESFGWLSEEDQTATCLPARAVLTIIPTT